MVALETLVFTEKAVFKQEFGIRLEFGNLRSLIGTTQMNQVNYDKNYLKVSYKGKK